MPIVLLVASPVAVSPLCSDNPQQIEGARRLVQQGLDEALVAHTQVLFRTWLSGGVDDPARAKAGILNELRGYFHAQKAVADFDIPSCERVR